MATQPYDFQRALAEAVRLARQDLGQSFQHTDKRANAYYRIATVLRQEAIRLQGGSIFRNETAERYLAAAIQLEEQAEITTYSGLNGRAALIGNYAAFVNNPTRYNVPLDVFSWQIDSAVVRFFELVSQTGSFGEISADSINAVDGLIWAEKGMLQSFPGTALGITYSDFPADSLIWQVANIPPIYAEQLRNDYGPIGYVVDGGGFGVATTFLSPYAGPLGGQPSYYGFAADVEEDYSGTPIANDDGSLYYYVDEFGRKIISRAERAEDGSYSFDRDGRYVWVENDELLGGLWGIAGGVAESAVLQGVPRYLLDFLTMEVHVSGPGAATYSYSYRETDGEFALDALKDRLGADFGPDGLRVRNNEESKYFDPNRPILSEREFLAQWFDVRKNQLESIPVITIVEPDGTRFTGRAIEIAQDDGTTAFYAQELIRNEDGTVDFGQIKRLRPVEGGFEIEEVDAETTGVVEQAITADEEQRANALQALEQQAPEALANASDEVREYAAGDLVIVYRSERFGIDYDADGNLIVYRTSAQNGLTFSQIDPETGNLLPRGFVATRSAQGWQIVDDKFRQSIITYDDDGEVIQTLVIDGVKIIDGVPQAGASVVQQYENGRPVSTNIRINDNPIGIEFSDIGSALGSQLGYRIAGDDVVLSIGASALLSTLGDNLGDVLDGVIGRQSIHNALDDAFDTFGPELLSNLRSAGIGAVSSFLTAELIKVIGVDGFAGEALNSGAGAVIGQVLTNAVAGNAIFAGINPTMIGSAIGSFLGTKLAMEVKTFETIGGQIGAAVGSTAFVAGGTYLAIAQLGVVPGLLPVAALAFVGFLVGGLIGSVFGGTPRSGADALWDGDSGRFVVANAYSRKGGSKEAAESAALTVASTLNGVLDAAGGLLLEPHRVQSGNYGMRKSDFVYRPTSSRDKRQITARFSGDDAMQNLIGYGIHSALTDPDFKIAGGSNIVKRAIYATFEIGNQDNRNFDTSVLLGNIASAQSYEAYLANSTIINALVAAEPDSVFAAETALTLTRAVELGLTKRHRSDWFGGFNQLLVEGGAVATTIQFGFDYDVRSQQVGRLIGIGRFVLGDSIDVSGQTRVDGTTSSDTIILQHSDRTVDDEGLQYQIAGGADRIAQFEGLTVNGEAATSEISVEVAATIDAGEGDDLVHGGNLGNNIFGGAGNDTLYGGRLDDWLLGGEGNDRLDAGAHDGGLGGDGNYLSGGAGDDLLFGREGSDWLEGGEGIDVIRAGDGGDILSGGAGEGDELFGGGGDDTYLFRRGDGSDLAEDLDVRAPASPDAPISANAITESVVDAIAARFADIRSGAVKRDWLGTSAAVSAGQTAGGEDSIAFGYGITLSDVRLSRSDDGKDLIVELTEIGENGIEVVTADRLTIRDWFADPFKRVEWLKFVDGTEIRIGDVTSFIVGGNGDDVLIGTAGNDFVYGGAGNDKLYTLAGNDVGLGGTGDDLVSGGADDDIVVGGLGNDDLIGGSGNDAVSGDAGNDSLYGSQGDDILSGGRGDDIVVGGAGNDTFRFSRGDGNDIVFDDYSDDWATVWKAGAWLNGYTYVAETSEVLAPDGSYVRKNVGTVEDPDFQWIGQFDYDDTTGELRRFTPSASATTVVSDKGEDRIEFALDINVQDIMFERAAGTNDLRVVVGRDGAESGMESARDSLTLKDWYATPGAIETFAFYGAGEIDVSASGYNLVAGTDGAAGTASTPLRGSVGKDWMTGAGGADHLAGGAGDDIVAGNAGSDHLKGEGGNDVLYGGSGNDILDGGIGSDVLSGGTGIDTASYASAANAVTVYLTNAALNQGDAAGDVYDSIENLIGSGAGDVLGGDDGDNEITGGKGSDFLLGGLGSDTYKWNIGDGADVIEDVEFIAETIVSAEGEIGENYEVLWTRLGDPKGSNLKTEYQLQLVHAETGELIYDQRTFTYDGLTDQPEVRYWQKQGWQKGFMPATDGSVTRVAYDEQMDGGEADAIEMGAGISLADLFFEREADNLRISYIVNDDGNNGEGLAVGQSNTANLLVRNHFLDKNRVEYLIFADGLAVSLTNIITADTTGIVNGTDLDELIVGQRGVRDDVLDGGAGDDVISGGEGNDTLRGGEGDDILEGGRGADVIDGGAHSPAPVEGQDAPGIRGDTVRYATSGAGVTVDLASSGPQVGGDAQGDTLANIENVTGSIYDDTLSGDDADNILDALGGNNILEGRGGNDVLVSGDGNDILDGGAGEDNLSGGGGNDVLRGGADNDVLAGLDGDDQLYGDDGDDILSAGSGSDRLEGGIGNDELIAGEGDDALLGGAGEDTLVGEAGDDSLAGGAGADTYFFAAGFGNDTLTDSEGANEILIDQSISYDALWFHRSGDDLVMSVRGADDTLTITDFYAASEAASVYSIQTSTHRLFLGHPEVRNFLDAMQAGGPDGAPQTIPADVAALMSRYWHEGTTARPYAEDFDVAIDEDTDTGAIAIGAIDHDENIDRYEIIGDAQFGTASVDADGRFFYTPDLNFNGADSFTVAVVDADNNAREIEVRVAVAPVDDAPVIDGVEGGGTLSVDEKALLATTATGTQIGRILASEFDGEAIFFTLTDDADGRFAISADGVVSVADAARLDHEAADSHSITVLVTDAVGSTDERSFVVAINDVNEENALPIAYGWDVAENSAVGTTVGQVVATDPDTAGEAFADQRYAFEYDGGLHGVSADGRYAIDALTGVVSVAATGDFEGVEPIRDYVVVARDNGGAAGFTESRTTLTIAITDVNEANSFAGDASFELAENEGPGKLVGTVSAADEDTPGTQFATQRYYFWDGSQASAISSDGRFAIDAETGAITATSSYDFESDVQLADYTVVARDNGAAGVFFSAYQTVSIALTNVNETPEVPVLESALAFIQEGSTAGTVTARFVLADPDGTVPMLVGDGNPGELFEIVGGEIRLAGTVDFETLAGLGYSVGDFDGDGRADIAVSVTVHADDGELRSADAATLTFFVEDVNEAPTSLVSTNQLAGFAERDRVASGTELPAITLAVLSVVDPDLAGQPNAQYEFTVDDDRFEIVGNELRLKKDVAFDYESEDQVTVTVTATDRSVDPLSIERELTFAIENVDDVLEGTPEPDVLVGQANRDIISGLSSADRIEGLGGDDKLIGNDGDDTIVGGTGDDEILGGNDNDRLFGGAGADTISGGSGHDVISGGAGGDVIDAGAGDDVIIGDDDNVADTIDGGEGIDRLDYSTMGRGISADLSAGLADGDSVANVEEIEGSIHADMLIGDAGDNRLIGGAGADMLSGLGGSDRIEGGLDNDDISGGDGNDLLFGDEGDDILRGDAGSDSLYGGQGADTLLGGAGDDRLEGGAGNDTLNAGDGNDTYVIDRRSNHDTIFNYDQFGTDIDVLGFNDTFGEITEHDLWFERQGDDLVVFVIGEDTSVRVTDWYVTLDADSRANHRLDFLLGGSWVSRDTDVEGLAEFQSTFPRPSTVEELEALISDPVYEATVATFYGINAPPEIIGIADQRIREDGSMELVLELADDYTPAAGIELTGSVVSGAGLLGPQGLVVGAVGEDGRVTVTLSPAAHVAGTISLSFTAVDAGGVENTQALTLTIDPVADTPVITLLEATKATSGSPIALSLSVDFPDRDGSEAQSIRIAGIPSGITLNNGQLDAASGDWVLSPADLTGLSVLAPVGWSQDLNLRVTAHAAEGGTSAQSEMATLTMVINAPPTDIVSGLSVAENSANGSAIGYLQGIDPDGDALTYELLDNAGGRFALDNDGMLRVADGAKLDYENAGAHSIRVRAIDTSGQTVERTLTVGVTDRNEANALPNSYGFSINEDRAVGTHVGSVSASDLDGAGTQFASQRYAFRNGSTLSQVSSDGLFAINATTGAITTAKALDHESKASGSYTVVARDNAGAGGANEAVTTVTIAIGDVNEANSLPASTSMSVAENGGIGALVGTVTASDPDAAGEAFADQRYYFLVDGGVSSNSADGRYAIDAVTGRITTLRSLDRESGDASTTHTVVARDNRGNAGFNQTTTSVTIAVTNVNEAPTIAGNTGLGIFTEPVANGTVVASFSASDPDGTTPTIVLTGDDAGLFTVVGGNIVMANGGPASFADAEAYANARGRETGDIDGDGKADILLGTVEVYATDGSKNSGVVRRDIYVENLSENPNAPTLVTSNLFSESGDGLSAHAGRVVATFSLSDPDGSTPAMVITSGNQNGWFQVAGNQIVFAPGVDFTADYLRANLGTKGIAAGFSGDLDGDGLLELAVANLTVAARDSTGLWSDTTALTVKIEDRNEAPEFRQASYAFGVVETAPAYTRVGQANAIDSDAAAGTLTYGFVGGSSRFDSTLNRNVGVSADGRLLIDAATGIVYLAVSDAYDSDAGATAFDYSIKVTDRNGDTHALTDTAPLRIEVSGVNEPHTLNDASGSVDEVDGLEPLVPIFDLRVEMLDDPEGRNMRWEFADGTNENGIWLLTSDGKLVLKNGGVDYEALTAGTSGGGSGGIPSWKDPGFEDQLSLQSYSMINEFSEDTLVIGDETIGDGGTIGTGGTGSTGGTGETGGTGDTTNPPNVMTLQVRAIDDSTGVVAEGTFTATVNDVNEGAILTSPKQYYIVDDQDEDDVFGTLRAYDPDRTTGAIRFAIDASSVSGVESKLSKGSSADVDNSANPYVYIVNDNQLKFQVPGDGEWEGGIKNHPTLGGRWYYQYDLSFDVVMTDPTNLQSRDRINVTFLKHGIHSAPPIVFDLDGDGIELVSLSTSDVYFDMDDDGIADRTGWVGSDDGILALDRNGNGIVDGIDEISFLGDVEGAESDLEGLVAFDTNGNGLLDAGDDRFFEFRIWRDLNQNGISEEGEMMSLPQAGIVSLELTSNPMEQGARGPDNFILGTVGYTRTNGSKGTAGDVFLAFEGSHEDTDDNSDGVGADGLTLAAPVILDFDGDGEALVGLNVSKTAFDQDGDGELERTAWFAAGDAVLAIDRNENGVIDDISEISFLQDVEGAKTDLEGLAAYDFDKNGVIDSNDIDFAALKLWFDRDSDGITDAGELVSLSEAGIAAISLDSAQDDTTGRQADGSMIYGKASFVFDDGREGTLFDTGLAYLSDNATHATGIAGSPEDEIAFEGQDRDFDRKSKKFYLSSRGGELSISLRKVSGTTDPRAGALGIFTQMTFSDRDFGYLGTMVLDLDGDGIEHRRSSKTRAMFDMNGDGIADDTGWTSGGDGFLVVDRNENGLVDDGSELSFMLDSPNARSAMQGLSAFDSNNDGLISVLDERFGELKIWVDANHNGISETGELASLADHGIVSISLRAAATSGNETKVGRNVLLSTAIFNREDGSSGTLGDLALGFVSTDDAGAGTNAVGTMQKDIWHRENIADYTQANPNGILKDQLSSYVLGQRSGDTSGADGALSATANAAASGTLGASAFVSTKMWHRNDQFRIDELTLSDILNDDFFGRFDRSDHTDPRYEEWMLTNGDVAPRVPQASGHAANAEEPSDVVAQVDAATPRSDLSVAEQARTLALLKQDMAAFGGREGLEEQLRSRLDGSGFYDLYM